MNNEHEPTANVRMVNIAPALVARNQGEVAYANYQTEPLFILRARDPHAVGAIKGYALVQKDPNAMIRAFEKGNAFREWQKKYPQLVLPEIIGDELVPAWEVEIPRLAGGILKTLRAPTDEELLAMWIRAGGWRVSIHDDKPGMATTQHGIGPAHCTIGFGDLLRLLRQLVPVTDAESTAQAGELETTTSLSPGTCPLCLKPSDTCACAMPLPACPVCGLTYERPPDGPDAPWVCGKCGEQTTTPLE